MSINIGSLIGTLITPILRGDVKCFGNDCYPLAFGVPSIFMFISIIVFIIGTPLYKRDADKKKGPNIIISTVGCIFNAVKNKIKLRKVVAKDHWLDYSDDKYNSQMISDVKSFCKVTFLFLPLPIFWTLYDQQGSRWTEQAQQLDGRIGSITVKPDQFQAFNSILIVTLVPVFDFVVYPLLAKCKLFKSLLQRIGVGLLVAVASFGIGKKKNYF